MIEIGEEAFSLVESRGGKHKNVLMAVLVGAVVAYWWYTTHQHTVSDAAPDGAARPCSTAWTSAPPSKACDGSAIQFRGRRGETSSWEYVGIYGGVPKGHLHMYGDSSDMTSFTMAMCPDQSFVLSAPSDDNRTYYVSYGGSSEELVPSGTQDAQDACTNASTSKQVWKFTQGQLWSAEATHGGYAVQQGKKTSTLNAFTHADGRTLDMEWRAAA